jgi:hypothetical protein
LPCSQELTTSSYVRGETNLRRINVFVGLILVKEKNFVFRQPDKKHKAAQKGRNDRGRQTDIKCVIFYDLLPFPVFFIPGVTQNLERD